jgi:hypothetical protein
MWRVTVEQNNLFNDIEDLGEALFHLSDKLRGSGFLADDANRDEYEAVVSAFAKLEERMMEP